MCSYTGPTFGHLLTTLNPQIGLEKYPSELQVAQELQSKIQNEMWQDL